MFEKGQVCVGKVDAPVYDQCITRTSHQYCSGIAKYHPGIVQTGDSSSIARLDDSASLARGLIDFVSQSCTEKRASRAHRNRHLLVNPYSQSMLDLPSAFAQTHSWVFQQDMISR